MIRESIQEEDIIFISFIYKFIFINIYASNKGAPQHIRQMLTTLEGKTDSNTVIVGDFNTHLHQWTHNSGRNQGNTSFK